MDSSINPIYERIRLRVQNYFFARRRNCRHAIANRPALCPPTVPAVLPANPKLPKSPRPLPALPAASHELEIVFVSIVTAPVSASARPYRIFAVVFSVMLSPARMFPAKLVLVPSVADLPACQNTPVPVSPFTALTLELLAVVSVLPIRNRDCALGFPSASKRSAPVNCADEAKK